MTEPSSSASQADAPPAEPPAPAPVPTELITADPSLTVDAILGSGAPSEPPLPVPPKQQHRGEGGK
jgi:hypothetical protein